MPIRWGIIGCGAVTEVKSGPGFQRARDSRLRAVMRRDGRLAEDYARRHGVPVWYDDAEKLVRDPDVDAVYVATPPGEHLACALAACAAGKPTYVEKPMARNHAECLRMIEAFAAARVPLFVAYYRRALDRFRNAAELVRSGALGTVTGVHCRFAGPHHRAVDPAALPWRLSAEAAGGGLFLDLGCHTLDVLDLLLGPLASVRGMAANVASPHAVEDTVAMVFSTAGGALGTASWNFASDERTDEIRVQGDGGELRLSTFGNEPVELRRGERVETFDLPNPPHIQQPMIQSIVDELLGRGECASTGVSAARTSAVMDAVLAGYYGGRDDRFWARPETWPGRRRPPG
jgi:predicted dehydrogenase